MQEERAPDFSIGDNITRVRERIRAACERRGRDPAEVTLIAVSKLKPFDDIREACAMGVTHFGENYVQELTRKMEENAGLAAPLPIAWHMIGHLQKNKVKYLIGRTALIHSVDTAALAEQIEKEAAKKNETVRILLEVNIAREESKWGFDPAEVPRAAEAVNALPHIRLCGLMTSAPLTDNPESNRGYFRSLKELAGELAERKLLRLRESGFQSPVLSMGMTGDFETAVEEGATMIRVGTAVFGKRDDQNGGTGT